MILYTTLYNVYKANINIFGLLFCLHHCMCEKTVIEILSNVSLYKIRCVYFSDVHLLKLAL